MTTTRTTLVVCADAPQPGRVAPRLSPPLDLEQAADLAAACFLDTLDVADALPAADPVVVLNGSLRRSARYAAIKAALRRMRIVDRPGDGPRLQIGIFTPQLTPTLLREAVELLHAPGVDAVVGPTPDGRRWALGVRDPEHAALVDDGEHSLRVETLPELATADTPEGITAVAAAAPWTRLATAVVALDTMWSAGVDARRSGEHHRSDRYGPRRRP